MFDDNRSNQSSPYFSGSKRRRDSLFAPSHPSLQPYLMGTSGARSPTQKRTRLSLGGSGNNSQDLEWSSLLNFQTSLRPARQRGSNLRRRETIHSLPGQPSPFSNSNSSVRAGVMNQSPGFFVRNRNERQSVARALQILDSRKRLRELSSSKQQNDVSDQQEQVSSSSIDEMNMKRRRLTINGTLDDILHQEQTFASTSLGEIANRSSSHGLSGVQSSSYVQKRIFTSSVLSQSEILSEPTSKRQRPLANASSTGESVTRLDMKKTEEKEADKNGRHTQTEAAQQRRLLSYIAPSQVEARYARQSAATELARSRSTSRSSTPSVTRQVTNSLATTGAQTELSCNQKEILQKSPSKEEETGKEDADKSSKKRGRHCQLSVKEFVAHLDRARSSNQTNQSNDVLKRSAVDNEARRERLNRLRKLLSDVTREPASAPTNVTTENRVLPSAGSAARTATSALTKTPAVSKFQSFGFGQSVTSTAPSMIGPTTSLPSSVTGGIAFGLSQKTSVTPSLNVSFKPTTTSSFGQSSTASSVKDIGQPSNPIITSIPSLSTSSSNSITPLAKSSTASSVTNTSESLAPVQQTALAVNATSSPSNIAFNFGHSGNATNTSSAPTTKGISFGQLPTSTSQSSLPFAFSQSTSNNPALSVTPGNSSSSKISAVATDNSKTNSSNAIMASSVITFGQPTSTAFSFGETKQPTVTTTVGPSSSAFSFGQTASTANSIGANSIPKTFSFGTASSNNVAAAGTNTSISKTVATSANSFAFGNTVSSAMSSVVTSTTAAPAFPQMSGGKGNAETFTFGATSNATKTDVNPTTNSTGLILGQQTSKTITKCATDTNGSLFSFNKSSEPSKVSSGNNSSLFGFGSSSTVNRKTSNNSQSGGGFSFTPNQQINKSEPNPTGASSGGLFSFGDAKGNGVSNSGSLFGNDIKKNSLVPSSSVSNSSTAPFSFASNTVAETGNKATPSAVTQPYSFGSMNGSTAASSTSSFAFDNNAKPSFVFGKTSSGSSESSGTQMGTGSFSFGTSQTEKAKQSVSDTPANKTNGTAGFTFHPPAPNQTGAFSFGGPPAVPSTLQPSNSNPSPFAFGTQQPVTPQAPAANMFSQTNPTSAPRKKVTGMLRKRSTRK